VIWRRKGVGSSFLLQTQNGFSLVGLKECTAEACGFVNVINAMMVDMSNSGDQEVL
jgi:hypothetical protein